jgi:hypothetical protein
MVEQRDNYVYLVEADPAAVARAARRVKLLTFIPIAMVLTLACWAWWVQPPDGNRLPLPVLITIWSVALAVLALSIHRISLNSVRQGDISLGADFVAGPSLPSSGRISIARFKDIVRVVLDVSQGRITGVTVTARRFAAVSARRVTDPAIIVRAIFEQAADTVKWRRSSWPCTRRLSREEVNALIEKAHVPDIRRGLPPSAEYARADDLFARDRAQEPTPGKAGLLRRLPGRGTCRSVNVVALRAPTPISRYVGLMLFQMFEDGPATRVLKRSEPLPVLTFRTERAEPPPLADVLKDLMRICGINAKHHSGMADGTIHIGIQRVPCKVFCHFDDSSNVCCELRLERMADQELREAEQKR